MSTFVFDDVGGRWLAVGSSTGACSGAPGEVWEAITLQIRPDGTLAGEFIRTMSNGCNSKRVVTFTRTGDVDLNSLPDPGTLPPRVVSPAQALFGRYRHSSTDSAEVDEWTVQTVCLRAGDRCMSFFHGVDNRGAPMVYGSGKWIWDNRIDRPCPAGGTTHSKLIAEFPLPKPPQDPITLLTGSGRSEESGSTCTSKGAFDGKFERIGD